ncbi:uncharacterized protein K02A2.6-like [Ostrea edulis]|uniref:uncharacterized protein K02A2.6-like n=1 Tax=Ostrea edulis TaxID=37623 RepID=UPI0024AF3FB6|nr:uncharacterized protein K02A2.6-like [Ostrea edulis]
MVIKLQWYDITVTYRKGTTMCISDALLRAYLQKSENDDSAKADMILDYYSKYIDAYELKSETTTAIIEALKTVFASHGLPVILRSDNGPQFSSNTFKKFCSDHGIEHERSSPHFQSSNGEAVRAVQTTKCLWMKCEDKQLALFGYRTTSLENIHLSPAQLLMGRRPRNALPASQDLLKPRTHDLTNRKTTLIYTESQTEILL